MKTPVLKTARLILRPLDMRDAQEVYECWANDHNVAKYMFWSEHDNISETVEWLEFEAGKTKADDWYRWGFVLEETGKLIGTGLIYYEQEFKTYEIGYNLGRAYWGMGYATEAMSAIIDFAKTGLKLAQIVGRHAKANTSSEHVLKKLGFVYERDCPYECNDGAVLTEGCFYRLTL